MKVADLRDKLTKTWQGLSPGRRSALVAVGAALLLAIFFLYQWSQRSQYAPLFPNLQEREAAVVVEKLKDMKVPYRLGGEGTTVLVPKEQIYELRLDLASSGVLSSGQGFELFDQNRLGMTDFQRNLDYQRALQEELRRTMISLDEVEDARVHLVIPQPSVFLREQLPPSAAVMLKLKPPARLEPEQVKGIMELVAASVAGLDPAEIRVIDMHGNVLSEDVDYHPPTAANKQQQVHHELTRQYEKDLERRIQGMLTRILGPGKAIAMVTAELNFDQQEIKETIYGPGALLSEQISTEQGSGGGAGGLSGTYPNVEPPVYQGVSPAGDSYEKSDTIQNYVPDVTETSTNVAPGQVRRLSTAVAVNGPVSNALNTEIEEIVSAAVGYQPDRGDQITVSSVAFDDSWEQKMAEEMAAGVEGESFLEQYFPWLAAILAGEGLIYFVLIAFLLVLFLVVLLLWLRRRRRARALPPPFEAEIPMEPVALEELEEEPVDSDKRRQEALKRAKQERVREIIRQRPEDVAVLLKTWLLEE